MKHYAQAYPNTDIVLIEPDQRDPEMYLANTFSYGQRRQMAKHAYQQTRQMLRARQTTLSAQLAPHGLSINRAVLEDPTRHLVAARPSAARLGRAFAPLEDLIDDLNRVARPSPPRG